MARFEWSDRMSVGSAVVDSDHRILVDLINRVHDIAAAGTSSGIGRVLDVLIAYIEIHFGREEKMLEAAGYARHYRESALSDPEVIEE